MGCVPPLQADVGRIPQTLDTGVGRLLKLAPMTNPNAELLKLVDAFLASTKMSETYFGRVTVNDGKFVARIREGGRVWPETADKVLAFIEKAKRKTKRKKKPNGNV